ncbi:protein GVQW3-like [Oratosquilla oratoria]|uniref:protein GVQW3-like n=1 Tax=Oratosquilla oratoria TaxID=337810 RepID=UPI003F776754
MQETMEQRYAIKLCVKFLKSKQKAYGMLKEVYGDELISKGSFYRWFKRFSEGNEEDEDEPRSGAPNSIPVGISIGTVDTVLTEDMRLHKVCTKFVPKSLSDDQRQFRMECCTGILDMISADSGFLNKVVTFNKNWVFTYDPESKHQSAQWKHTSSSRPKRAKKSRSQEKAIVIPFFDSKGLIQIKWIPEGSKCQ